MVKSGHLECTQISETDFQCDWTLYILLPKDNCIQEHVSATFVPSNLLPFQLIFTSYNLNPGSQNEGINIDVYLNAFPKKFALNYLGVDTALINRRISFIQTLQTAHETLAKSEADFNFSDKFPQKILNFNRCVLDTGYYLPYYDFLSGIEAESLIVRVHIISESLSAEASLPRELCNHYSSFLIKDLKSLYNSGTLSDVTFRIKTETLRAHKLILASRSSVLQKIIRDSGKTIIDVHNCDYKMFDKFLRYLYTGEMEPENFDAAVSLYSLACIYEVQALAPACSDIISSQFNSVPENDLVNSVCKILRSADHFGNAVLKNLAIHFIVQHFHEIQPREDWKHILRKNRALSLEVLDEVTVDLKYNKTCGRYRN